MSDKVILRHNGGGYWWTTDRGPAMRACDVVAGNRYSEADSPHRLVPDDSGPWLALETYRGPDAPPRPEVLPVGTRVRRGASATRKSTSPGTVRESKPYVNRSIVFVVWDDGSDDSYFRDSLEVVSLPEPAKAGALLRHLDGSMLEEGGTSDAPWGGAWLEGHWRACIKQSRLTAGRKYAMPSNAGPMEDTTDGDIGRQYWTALRDFQGPEYREPARAIHGQVVGDPVDVGSAAIAQPTDGPPPLGPREQAIVDRLAALGWECGRRFCDAPLTWGSVRVWLRASGPEICGGPKLTRAESAYSGPADARLYHTALGQALDAIEATAPPVEIPGESSGVPDYAHPRAALRARTFVVPTDLDDHLIPDAEPGWGGPR